MFNPKRSEKGTRVAEICPKSGISQATYFGRRTTYEVA